MNKLNIHSLLTDYSFVVPEIQREYVWGNKTNKNDYVLRQFLIDLDDKVSMVKQTLDFCILTSLVRNTILLMVNRDLRP